MKAWVYAVLTFLVVFAVWAVAKNILRDMGAPGLLRLIFGIAGLAAMFYIPRAVFRGTRAG
jgi:hypothetical protein